MADMPGDEDKEVGEEEDTHDDGLEGNEVTKKRKGVEDKLEEGNEVPEMGEDSSHTQNLFAGIIPFLRLHHYNFDRGKMNILECPWGPRGVEAPRVEDLVNKLDLEKPGPFSCMDGQTMVIVITTFSINPPDPSIAPMQPLFHDPSWQGQIQPVIITPTILQRAIKWASNNEIDPLTTELDALLETYLGILANAFFPELGGISFDETLRLFINSHEWNCSPVFLQKEDLKKQVVRLCSEPAETSDLLDFILLHLPWHTKVVAHVGNGQQRLAALEWLMLHQKSKNPLPNGWQRMVQSMFYLPKTVDSNFALRIKKISTQHQINTSLMMDHNIFQFFQLADKYLDQALLKFPLLQDWLGQVYYEVLGDQYFQNEFEEKFLTQQVTNLVAKLGETSETMSLKESKKWASELLQRFAEGSSRVLWVTDYLDVCICAWIDIFSTVLYKVLSMGQLRQLVTTLAGFDLPEYATFTESFKKKMGKLEKKTEKLDIFPYDKKRTVTIRGNKRVFQKKTTRPNQIMFVQIFLWSRLSQPSHEALCDMMENLSGAPNLKPDQADRILWNFFHSVVDEVSFSKPIWAHGFFCAKDGDKRQQYQHVQYNHHCVQHFCLLLSAVKRCASAFTDWSDKSSELKAVQDRFFVQNALTGDDFPDCNIPPDLWNKLAKFYTSFFGNDGFTFVTVAHSRYLRLELDPTEHDNQTHQNKKEYEKDFYKKNFHSLWYDEFPTSNPFCMDNEFCPFGTTEKQIHCAGHPLLNFLRGILEGGFEDLLVRLKKFVLEVTCLEFNKDLGSTSQRGALPVTKDRQRQGRVGLKATIDGHTADGQTALLPQNTTTEVQPQLQLLPPRQPAHGDPDPADLNNPPPAQPPKESQRKSTRKKQGSQTQEKQNQTKIQGSQTQKKRKSVTQEGKGKGKQSLNQVNIGIETVAEIYKFTNLLTNNKNRLIPSIDQYLKVVPNNHVHRTVLKDFKHHLQTVVKLVSPLKKPKSAKLQHAILEGGDDNARGKSVLLTTVHNLQQHDESYDQEIALHHTAVAGKGADDAPSDPEPEDDSGKPYPKHPFVDDEAKEGGENDDDLDYNFSAGYNDTKADETSAGCEDDTEDDKTKLDSTVGSFCGSELGPMDSTLGSLSDCDQLDPDQLDPLSPDDELGKILETIIGLSTGENYALDMEFDRGQVRCRGPGRGEAEAEAEAI